MAGKKCSCAKDKELLHEDARHLQAAPAAESKCVELPAAPMHLG